MDCPGPYNARTESEEKKMDYVAPKEIVQEAVRLAKAKSSLSIRDMLIRGILAGAFLGYATSLALIVTSQDLPPIAGAILFPAGFVMLALLGTELATGNFALLTAGVLAGEVSFSRLLRNWGWVYVGNLLGSVLYGSLFFLAVTNFGKTPGGALGDLAVQAAQKKTLAYMALGAAGWGSALVKGILCNWMVTIGAVLALASRSTVGKVLAMWLPIMTFFAHGYEHSIVNMFLIPTGMMFGAAVSTGKWLLWNLLPVMLGNILSGAMFTGALFHLTYYVNSAAPEKGAVVAFAGSPTSHPSGFAHAAGSETR
jgi:formate/nitrite transporter